MKFHEQSTKAKKSIKHQNAKEKEIMWTPLSLSLIVIKTSFITPSRFFIFVSGAIR